MTDFSHLPYRPNVGLMIVNAQGFIFVGHRRDNFRDAWQMPQGGVDEGEPLWDAALRELYEETGISSDKVVKLAETDGWLNYELPPDLVPSLWGGKYRGQKQKWYLLRFTGTDDAININIETEEPEFSKWRWMPPHDICKHVVFFKLEIYQKILHAFDGQY